MNRMNAINKYRLERWFYEHHCIPIAWLIRSWIYLIHNSFIPYTCEIGRGTVFGYKGIGVVIHSEAKIGNDCIIGTNVTIGGGGGGSNKKMAEFDGIRRNGVPVIRDRVYISTGAKVIGGIVVGNDVTIGANAVVINDVPDNVVVGGVPAKIIHEQGIEN